MEGLADGRMDGCMNECMENKQNTPGESMHTSEWSNSIAFELFTNVVHI